VLLCVDCHAVAQAASERLKRQIAAETGIPLTPAPAAAPAEGSAAAAPSEGSAAADAAGAAAAAAEGRRAATALLGHGADMPAARRAELEGAVLRGLGRSGGGGGAALQPGDLLAALEAGAPPKSRRRAAEARGLAQRVAKYMALPRPPAPTSTDGGAAAAAARDPSVAAAREPGAEAPEACADAPPPPAAADKTHMAHGARVVAAALAAGGEGELHALMASFRQSFVAACRPRHLPQHWAVGHAAPREFGAFSVYRPEAG